MCLTQICQRSVSVFTYCFKSPLIPLGWSDRLSLIQRDGPKRLFFFYPRLSGPMNRISSAIPSVGKRQLDRLPPVPQPYQGRSGKVQAIMSMAIRLTCLKFGFLGLPRQRNLKVLVRTVWPGQQEFELNLRLSVGFLFHINGQMSERVMTLIESMVCDSEVYSIDKNKLHTVDAQS